MPPGKYQGCRRGIFGLRDWSYPLPRPKIWADESPDTMPTQVEEQSNTVDVKPNMAAATTIVEKKIAADDTKSIQAEATETVFTENQTLLVKFSYTSNPSSPLGSAELDVSQKEKVVFLNYHPEHEMWVNVRKSDSQEGYIPANYVMAVEDKLTELPWLKKAPSLPQEKAEYKPYVSAYAKKDEKSDPEEKFYCDICERGFNGPQPYKAHLVSKAHKEEVEVRAEYD